MFFFQGPQADLEVARLTAFFAELVSAVVNPELLRRGQIEEHYRHLEHMRQD